MSGTCEKRAAPNGEVAPGARAGRADRQAASGTALELGAHELELRELLSAVSGRETAPIDGADLLELARASPAELRERQGWTRASARRIAAAFELGRRLAHARQRPRPVIRTAAEVFALCSGEMQGLEREVFHVLLLDGKHRLKAREIVSIGSLTSSIVHPREVFRSAVRHAAAAVICAHNHPSGDPEPSAEDLEVTRRLHQAGRLLGVPLLDHVVLGDGGWVSLRERLGL